MAIDLRTDQRRSTEPHRTTEAPRPSGRPSPPNTHAARRPTGAKAWRARLVVLLMMAAAVYGGVQVFDARSAELANYGLDTVTLTAQSVPVEALRPGQVTDISVRAQQRVREGQELGQMVTTSTSATGKVVRTTVDLKAPAAGVVSDEPVPVGTTLQPGQPFVKLYDPADLTFLTDVPVRDLPELSRGMAVRLTAPGVPGQIDATLQRVVPRVGTESTNVAAGYLRVVLAPVNAAKVAALVPGLRFTGAVDTTSVGSSDRTPLYETR